MAIERAAKARVVPSSYLTLGVIKTPGVSAVQTRRRKSIAAIIPGDAPNLRWRHSTIRPPHWPMCAYGANFLGRAWGGAGAFSTWRAPGREASSDRRREGSRRRLMRSARLRAGIDNRNEQPNRNDRRKLSQKARETGNGGIENATACYILPVRR